MVKIEIMKTIGTIKNSIVCDGKLELTSDEVDIDLKYDVLGKKLADKAYEKDGFNLIEKGIITENHPIKISLLEEIIAKLKKAGCNYIEIDYNCDHPDYTFCGVDAHIATEEELKEQNEKDRIKDLTSAEMSLANIDKKREQLIEEIKNLKK